MTTEKEPKVVQEILHTVATAQTPTRRYMMQYYIMLIIDLIALPYIANIFVHITNIISNIVNIK